MKKKVLIFIIMVLLIVTTGLYIYIDNFEITSDDLPSKTNESIENEKEEKSVVKASKKTIILDSVEDLMREKYAMMDYMSGSLNDSTQEVSKNNEVNQVDQENTVENNVSSENINQEIVVENGENTDLVEESEVSDKQTLDDETIESAKDEAKTKDKAQAMALAVKRLSPEQIKRLMTIAKGGFTVEEKAEALDMFYENFTEEEQEWILLKFEEYMGG